MSETEKRFAPTDYKLRRLRLEGKFPHSRSVIVFAGTAGMCAAFISVAAGYGEPVRRLFADSFAGRTGGSHAGGLREFFDLVSGGGLRIGVLVAGAVIIAGVLQNRFYLGFSRLFRPARTERPALGQRLRSYGAALILALIVSLIAWWFLLDAHRYYIDTFLPLVIERKYRGSVPMNLFEVRSNLEAAMRLLLAVEIELLRARLGMLIQTVLGVLLFSAIIGRVLAGVEFHRQHGMTREELESELQEGEVSQQMRDAQRSRSLEPDKGGQKDWKM